MRILFVASIFLGSFLLFLVQPMFAKAMLPAVGGAPAIWVTAMLFFQVLLLLGYGYAALGSAFVPPRKQVYLHLALCVLAIVVALPVHLRPVSEFNNTQPEFWVLATLLLSIGLPYFVLTANSSLLQRWYHHTFNASPYFLFGISNTGSFLGLLGYPFLIEWMYPLPQQMMLWSGAFILLAVLILFVSMQVRKTQRAETKESLGKNLTWESALRITFLGFVPSSLFLSVTLLVTTDIASFPLLWVIPLSLYLLSFILAFSTYSESMTRLSQFLHPLAFMAVIGALFFYANIWLILLHFIVFFIIAMSCHGQAAREKPKPDSLTAYYFWLSVGGALGGLFNTLAPYMFIDVYEYYIVIMLSLMALPRKYRSVRTMNRQFVMKMTGLAVFFAVVITVMWQTTPEMKEEDVPKVIAQDRNFFGISKVMQKEDRRLFVHGNTLHGQQPEDEKFKLKLNSYYVPLAKLLNQMPDSFFEQPFSALGLGAGTFACMGRKGQLLDFVEIDSYVIDIAKNPDYFTYLRDCPPRTEVFRGDGRLLIAKQDAGRYNLIVMDAFTSDAVPVHLITHEAVGMYMSKLQPQGFLAFNISNREIDMKNVVARLAQEYGWRAYLMKYHDDPDNPYDMMAHWLFMVKPDSPWQDIMVQNGANLYVAKEGTPLWTDGYSNLLPLLKMLNPQP